MQNQKNNITNFYQENGIKQYNSFSGGFRYLNKSNQSKNKNQSKHRQSSLQNLNHIYQEFGVLKTNVKSYKLEKDYVPNTKQQLADKLMQKIQHNLKKMRYYRNKYFDPSLQSTTRKLY